jgi:hypothetical protein
MLRIYKNSTQIDSLLVIASLLLLFTLEAEVWNGRGTYLKRKRYHARGRMGLVKAPRSNLHIILKEVAKDDPRLLSKAEKRERKYIERLERLAEKLKKEKVSGGAQVQANA